MGGLLSKKKPEESRITEQDKAILALKQQRDKLKQHQKKIRLNLKKEQELGKDLLKNGKKDKAMSLLNEIDGQLYKLQQMVQKIEFAQKQSQVVEGLSECLDKMCQETNRLLATNPSEEDEDAVSGLEETTKTMTYPWPIQESVGGMTLPDSPTDL